MDCEEQLTKTDVCIRKALLIGDRELVIPKNSQEMDQHCKKGREQMQCVRGYGKCLKLFPRQIFGMVLGNIRKLFKETCDSESGRQQFLKHSLCLRPEHLPKMHNLIDRFTIQLSYVANNVSKDGKIPYICCAYFLNQVHLRKTVSNMCDAITGPSTTEYVIGMFNRVVSEAIDLGCGKYRWVENFVVSC